MHHGCPPPIKAWDAIFDTGIACWNYIGCISLTTLGAVCMSSTCAFLQVSTRHSLPSLYFLYACNSCAYVLHIIALVHTNICRYSIIIAYLCVYIYTHDVCTCHHVHHVSLYPKKSVMHGTLYLIESSLCDTIYMFACMYMYIYKQTYCNILDWIKAVNTILIGLQLKAEPNFLVGGPCKPSHEPWQCHWKTCEILWAFLWSWSAVKTHAMW